MSSLDTKIKYLTSVGEKRASIFNTELEIFTFEDLLYYFPYKYIDKTKFYKIEEIDVDLSYIQVKGKITNFKLIEYNNRKRLSAIIDDGTGKIELIWFKGFSWLTSFLKLDKEFIVFGKPSQFKNMINIVHPEIEEVIANQNKNVVSFQSEYSLTEKLKKSFITSKVIHKLQKFALKATYKEIEENLPDDLMKQTKLLSRNQALLNIHYPQSQELFKKANYRLKFEELFFIQLSILFKKNQRSKKLIGFNFDKIGDYFNNFYKKNLPFELTNAQKRVVKEIRKDLGKKDKQMNRLLQGDVGSGKTIVAIMTMLIALDNGFQACLVAPTEILAIQHFESIKKLLAGLNIKVDLLTGSSTKRHRLVLHEELIKGYLQILVGTHAIMEDVVQFKNLGVVIIDEQHRFGVAQRAKLWGKNTQVPHVLVMTATPIPRTLAMTLYGDLEYSIIDELPPNRKAIKTIHSFDNQRLRIFEFIRKEIKKGHQVYVVYPLITESEHFDYKDLEDGYESITRAFPAPEYAVSVMHGQMHAREKEKAMQLFTKGITQIMVATTVIEVGVDVPNASLMIIESAEKFGLSQLHQLRGRVGRGAEQSYCVLMTSFKLTKEGRKRIKVMVDTNDGFKIAEEDLRLRGSGNLQGTEQSGMPFKLRISNLYEDGNILSYARDMANMILGKDNLLEKPENKILIEHLKKLKKNKLNWSIIS